jgi:hypothetical protein
MAVFFIAAMFINIFDGSLFAQSDDCPPPPEDYNSDNADDNFGFIEGAKTGGYFFPLTLDGCVCL